MTIATGLAVFIAGYVMGALSGLATVFLVALLAADKDDDEMNAAYEEWQ